MSKRNKRANIVNLTPAASASGKTLADVSANFRSRLNKAAKNAVAFIFSNKGNKRYEYGQFDNLPNAIIAHVLNSGTATSCANKLAEFIEADGFIDPVLDKIKANRKQTLRDIVTEQALNLSFLKGFALRLVFNNAGKIVKIYQQDIKTIRRVHGHFEVNDLMGEPEKSEAETYMCLEFDPERDPTTRRKDIQKQVEKYGEQKGEILYVFKKGLGKYYDIYPVPDFYSGIEDIISDGKLSQLDLRNITKGFRTPVIISTGPIDDQTEDEDGKTAQDYFDESLEDFTGEDASSILHLKGATEEFKPSVTTLDLKEILDQTEGVSDRVSKKVARWLGVPDVLISMAKEGTLGQTQELKNQMELFALTVYRLQNMIKSAFDMLAPHLALEGMPQNPDFTLSTLKLFNHLPDYVLQQLSAEELREMFEIDLKASPEAQTVALSEPGAQAIDTEANEAFANLTGRQLQGIQRIVRKYNKTELTYDQAALMLGSGFKMTPDQVAVWLVTSDEEETQEL